MKVWLATSGEYSDFSVLHAFAREEDALAYGLGDDVMELEINDGPIEVRTRHSLTWYPDDPDQEGDGMRFPNPHTDSVRRDFDGRPKHAQHHWARSPRGEACLVVEGWELERVRKVYSEQRAQYIARKDMGTA